MVFMTVCNSYELESFLDLHKISLGLAYAGVVQLCHSRESSIGCSYVATESL
jgi:hypothetical protein